MKNEANETHPLDETRNRAIDAQNKVWGTIFSEMPDDLLRSKLAHEITRALIAVREEGYRSGNYTR